MPKHPLPTAPKIPLKTYLKTAPEPITHPVQVLAPDQVTVSQTPFESHGELDDWLLGEAQTVTTVTVPQTEEPLDVSLIWPESGSANVHLVIEPGANVTLHEQALSAGNHLGLGLWVSIGANAQVSWVSYDAFTAETVVLSRTVNLDAHARLNWTVAGFSHNSGATLLTTHLEGDGASATVNVGVLASGEQHVGYTTNITNKGLKTSGHINQRGVIVEGAHLIFNGIGHIEKGARGSDNQQENRVLMLGQNARGDANPILLIDENDVTAGHAASVTRVDQGQMYYLMSRGLSEALASRLVIRGFLEAGLSEIDDDKLKQTLFKQIDETLVNQDA